MNAYYKGMPVFGPRGPAGPDGNPIGTVISFMGTAAPEDYLVCDGETYGISDYPELADFFRRQFGGVNHFGGDGSTTFAVPDLRNLFLRGYHGGAEEALSGEVGARQEATEIPNVKINNNNNMGGYPGGADAPAAVDSYTGAQGFHKYGPLPNSNPADIACAYFTVRPVNMAVLFCIKAVESVPAENAYSAGETRIGTWADGKPLYRRVILETTPAAAAAAKMISVPEYGTWSIKRLYGGSIIQNVSEVSLNANYGPNIISVYGQKNLGSITIELSSTTQGAYFNQPVWIVLEYTKTVDEAANTTPAASASAQPKAETGQTGSVIVLKPNPDFKPDLSVIASVVGSAGNLTVSFSPASYASATSGICFAPASFAHASASAGILTDGGNDEEAP